MGAKTDKQRGGRGAHRATMGNNIVAKAGDSGVGAPGGLMALAWFAPGNGSMAAVWHHKQHLCAGVFHTRASLIASLVHYRHVRHLSPHRLRIGGCARICTAIFCLAPRASGSVLFVDMVWAASDISGDNRYGE